MVRVKTSARDRIKAAQDRPEETVELPEWNVTLRVRGMSAADVIGLSKHEADGETYAQNLLSRCVFDEDGERVYPTVEDAAELMQKSLSVVQRLLVAARRVNGIEGDEKKD